jgi:hypothetical protein
LVQKFFFIIRCGRKAMSVRRKVSRVGGGGRAAEGAPIEVSHNRFGLSAGRLLDMPLAFLIRIWEGSMAHKVF